MTDAALIVLEEEIASKILSLLETTPPNHNGHGEIFPENMNFFDIWSSFPNL